MRASLILWAMLASVGLMGGGCASAMVPPPAPTAPAASPSGEVAQDAHVTPAHEPGWRYEVAIGDDACELVVTAVLDAGWPSVLSVERGAEPFLREVEVLQQGQWQPVMADGTTWTVEACEAQGCTLRYHVMFAEMAAAVSELDVAQRFEGVVVSAPPAWLLHPLNARKSGRLEIVLQPAKGVTAAFGLRPAQAPQTNDAQVFAGDVLALPEAPYASLGNLRMHRIPLAGGRLEVAIAGQLAGPQTALLLPWITRAAQGVASYYGRFPIDRAVLTVVPVDGKGVMFGRTLGGGGASIVLGVGRSFDAHDLHDDWVLVHELIHLALPSLPPEQRWLEEGLSTYVEPIIRHQAGLLDEQSFWREMMRSMPQGLAREGDGGLDGTKSWGRTYWGGALFCLLTDIEIRARTDNARSLQDVLRAVVSAGGNASTSWSLAQLLAVAEQPGAGVLREQHLTMGQRRVRTNLDALWRELGVRIEHERVIFDDRASRAYFRRALLSRERTPAHNAAPATH